MSTKKTKREHTLSKSTFLRGVQCPKSLYLNACHPELRDEIGEDLLAIFKRGNEVGELAQSLFPGGINASPEKPLKIRESVAYTRKLMSEGIGAIYEAAFLHRGLLCYVDILVNDNGKWKVYEVKSSTSISDVYLMDTAFQYYLITESGIHIDDIFLVHINNQYVRRGVLDIQALFTVESVLEEVRSRQKFVTEQVRLLQKVLRKGSIPDIDIGEHCTDPYECDFRGYCWQHVPEHSVFEISRLKKSEAFELYRRGIVRLEDIPDDYPLNRSQRLQVECHTAGSTFVDYEHLAAFLEHIRYPLSFMDFETFMPAVPLFDNTRPYQQIPFQYSLHYREEKGAEPEHREFLAEAGSDPRKEFIERLLDDTARPGDILVYSSFEITRLRELARDVPASAERIEALISRIKDLMIPFQKRYFYAPAMRGSYSIKAVLPALVPDMSYGDMPVADGGAAMRAFEELWYETDEERREEIRRDLLAYCKLDTLAMVRIVEQLEELKRD